MNTDSVYFKNKLMITMFLLHSAWQNFKVTFIMIGFHELNTGKYYGRVENTVQSFSLKLISAVIDIFKNTIL